MGGVISLLVLLFRKRNIFEVSLGRRVSRFSGLTQEVTEYPKSVDMSRGSNPKFKNFHFCTCHIFV